MKKILLFAAVLFTAGQASAQISIAPEAGIQMTDLRMSSSDSSLGDFGYKTGFRAGVNFAAELNDFSIHAGAFYTTKGAKSESFGVKLTINMTYIDIPVYVNYNILNKSGNKLFVGVGPYLSYCMSGKIKAKGSFLGQSIDQSEDLNIGSSATDQIRSLDFGGNANIGFISAMGLYARASYSLGFANIANNDASEGTIKTTGFALSVGYQVKL
ncbi:MAG: PorT family protein [Chitinophagaceae bacterium]|nr:PorT family protein [Chitinophagaceae bacterium]